MRAASRLRAINIRIMTFSMENCLSLQVYNAIRANPDLWKSTAILVVYDEHGGIYDHVAPPACPKDGFKATPDQTGVPGLTFEFDRLGVRVPAILISPWVAKATVVPGPGEPGGRTFEHASIPRTVTKFFLGDYPEATRRERMADTFPRPAVRYNAARLRLPGIRYLRSKRHVKCDKSSKAGNELRTIRTGLSKRIY